MKAKNLNHLVSVYSAQLMMGDIQVAYSELIKFVQKLKTEFSKDFSNEYAIGNVFQGYMDYTYFYLSNDYLRNKKLKFGLVFNHAETKFEIWLLGQTKDIQKKYWHLLKNTKWVKSNEIPQYSIFETTLVNSPDFDDLNKLIIELKKKSTVIASEILDSLKLVSP